MFPCKLLINVSNESAQLLSLLLSYCRNNASINIVSVDASFWRQLQIVRSGGDATSCDATIKAGAANEELSLLILTSTHVDSVSVAHAPCAVVFASIVFLIHNNIVTLSQVLHIARTTYSIIIARCNLHIYIV